MQVMAQHSRWGEGNGAVHKTIVQYTGLDNCHTILLKILVCDFHAELIWEICKIVNLAKQKRLKRMETGGVHCQ
jgi:hypothetical protein